MAASLRLLFSAAVLHVVLIQPNHPGAVTWGALALFPLELPMILAGLAALSGRQVPLRCMLAGVLVVLVVLKAADFAMFVALNRGFNPVADWGLVAAGWSFALGALGWPLAAVAMLAALVAVAVLAAAIHWATGAWTGLARGPGRRSAIAAFAVAAAVLAAAEIGHAMRFWRLPFDPPGAAFTARLAIERVRLVRETLEELADFRAATRNDPEVGRPDQLGRLGGRDVFVVFVESYGRASFDNPLYAPDHLARLESGAGKVSAAGLSIRSGWLAYPIEGGQSWLAHATFASGLRVDNQVRFAALLRSHRRTLWEIARSAGYQTAAVVPAITMAWPEGERLGFEVRLAAADLGYAGPPFNWITMPDQFTLSAFASRLPPDGRPLFAMIALISSHAPWVPVPELLPWGDVGDGQGFSRFTEGAPTPAEVWADRDRIRAQYREAIGYSLDTVFDWAARQGPEGPLLIVLGDHPAVGFVSGAGGRDVPVHLVGPPAVLALFDGWNWTPGPIPSGDLPSWPMEEFRDRFLAALRQP